MMRTVNTELYGVDFNGRLYVVELDPKGVAASVALETENFVHGAYMRNIYDAFTHQSLGPRAREVIVLAQEKQKARRLP